MIVNVWQLAWLLIVLGNAPRILIAGTRSMTGNAVPSAASATSVTMTSATSTANTITTLSYYSDNY